MRITVYGPNTTGQLADSLAYALGRLGYEVSPVSNEPIVPATKLGRFVARKRPELLRSASHRSRQREIADAVIATRPDLIVAVKAAYLWPSTIDRIRARTGASIINWYPDNPFVYYGPRPPLRTLAHYDRMVVFSPELANRVKRSIGIEAHYIPFGFDPRYYFPAPQPREIKADVAFVGHCRPERAALVGSLLRAGFSVRVAGPGWDRVDPAIRSAWQPGPAWGFAAARLYHEARVGLNDLHPKSNAHSHNMRSWEIPATDTPMATTDSAHQRELLREVPSVAYYAGPADLPSAVERLITSRNGHPPVDLSAHTYEERCRSLLATL